MSEPQPREPAYEVAVTAGRALFRGLKLGIEVRGEQNVPRQGPAVLAVTHFGYLDFALTEWAVHRRTKRYTRFLVTAAAFDHRVAGPILRRLGHVPVDRKKGVHAYREAVGRLREGELVGVFPEGRVHRDEVGPLKTGAVRMAAEARVPLVPVVVSGGERILTRHQRFSLGRAYRARVVVSFGEPLHPTAEQDPDATTRRLRARMGQLLADARVHKTPLAPWPGGDHADAPNPDVPPGGSSPC